MFWPTRIRASSLSSVSRVGVDRMFALTCVSSARARKARFVIMPSPGIVIVPFMTPSARPCADDAGVGGDVDDVVAAAARREVGAADARAPASC